MATFLIAYLVVWIAFTLYALRLGASRRRLERALKSRQSQAVGTADLDEPTSKAA